MPDEATRFDSWLDAPVGPGALPAKSYLVCTTERSGSTHFCDLLRSTGKLGQPHEYFSAWMMQRLGRPHRFGTVTEHAELVRTLGCTANGIHGAKVFRYTMDMLGAGAVMAAMGQPTILFLERMDLIGQAVSYARSAITRAFHAGEAEARVPEYDGLVIRTYLERLIRDNAAWRLWFARQGITPLHIAYEDLIANPQAVIDRVARALGVDGPVPIKNEVLQVRVQRDSLNAEWRARFLASEPGVPAIEDIRSERQVTIDRRWRKLLRLAGRT